MELSNLRPAEGSKHSDNFRRGRGHGSGNGKTAGKGHKGQLRLVPEHQETGISKVDRCLYTDVFRREVSRTEILKKSIAINVDVL